MHSEYALSKYLYVYVPLSLIPCVEWATETHQSYALLTAIEILTEGISNLVSSCVNGVKVHDIMTQGITVHIVHCCTQSHD